MDKVNANKVKKGAIDRTLENARNKRNEHLKAKAASIAATNRSLDNARAKKREQDAAKLEKQRANARLANIGIAASREKMSAYKAADQKISNLKKKRAELIAQKNELTKDTYTTVVRGNKTKTIKNQKPLGNSLRVKNIEGQISSLDTQIAVAQEQKQKEQQKLYKTKKKGLF